ncbi:hypothetical protein PVK06_002661 [Gossypium arboreum]|uniref:Uncharacterized protein n=1 Tax=Gossypium arboreum TaxID=29729 RepID=A0ABR0R4D2_GOSAR|nr:hypothetical protein PVK06_002661 [Gossypium arboreum]
MVVDRVLEGLIHNMGKPLIPQIRGYLQETGFLITSRMLGGCKLDSTLISALLKRWRPKTYFSPSMQQEYNHTRGCNVTTRSASGWASRHGISDRSR